MVSVYPLHASNSTRSLHRLSLTRSILLARQHQSPIPRNRRYTRQHAVSTTSADERKARGLRITKHWNTDFRGNFDMTWASRAALDVSSSSENKAVAITTDRPPGLINWGLQGQIERFGRMRRRIRKYLLKLPGATYKRPSNMPYSYEVFAKEGVVEEIEGNAAARLNEKVFVDPEYGQVARYRVIDEVVKEVPVEEVKKVKKQELVPNDPFYELEKVAQVHSTPRDHLRLKNRRKNSVPHCAPTEEEIPPEEPDPENPPEEEEKSDQEQANQPPDQQTPPPIFAPETPSNHTRLSRTLVEDFNWYWETFPPSISEKTRANHFFTKNSSNARFLVSAPTFRHIPESNLPEVAFMGRSNVGKSSLLNAVVNADIKVLLARTSPRPGFTTTMNMYGFGPSPGVVLKKTSQGKKRIVGPGGLTILDMPGYGHGSLRSWGTEIMKYLRNRMHLRRVFVLIDAQVGVTDKDRSVLSSLRLAGISHQIIISKVDKCYIPLAREIKRYDGRELTRLRPKGSLIELRTLMERVRETTHPRSGAGALGEMLACSAETRVDGKRLGIDHVRYAVLKACGLVGGVGSFKGDAFTRVVPETEEEKEKEKEEVD